MATKDDNITGKPCAVCGNATKGQLNRHHLITKEHRRKGTAQLTIKLCRDQEGCRTHLLFHKGDKRAARKIRAILEPADITWMEQIVGKDWVAATYPTT